MFTARCVCEERQLYSRANIKVDTVSLGVCLHQEGGFLLTQENLELSVSIGRGCLPSNSLYVFPPMGYVKTDMLFRDLHKAQ